MSAESIGKELVQYCQQGKNIEAIEKLYDQNIVSVEAAAMPGMPQELRGIGAIKEKNQWWLDNHEIHSSEVKGPYPHGERFAVYSTVDCTNKKTKERINMAEVALYTVKNDKIVKEEFFYLTGT